MISPEPLDFWNYPRWTNGSADVPSSSDYSPIWLRSPYIPPPPPPPPPRIPARTIGPEQGLGFDCGRTIITMPERLKHVRVTDHSWAFLVVRSQGAMFRGATLTIPKGPLAGVYEWTGELWQEFIEEETN